MSPNETSAGAGRRRRYDRLYLDTSTLATLASSDAVGLAPATVTNPRTSYAVRSVLQRGHDAGFDYLWDALKLLRDPLDAEGDHDGPGIVVAGSLVHQRKPELTDRLATDEAATLYQAWAADAPLATDDRDVRAVADSYGVPVTGSLGLLARAVEQERVTADAADDHLATWTERGYRSPVEHVADLLVDGT